MHKIINKSSINNLYIVKQKKKYIQCHKPETQFCFMLSNFLPI